MPQKQAGSCYAKADKFVFCSKWHGAYLCSQPCFCSTRGMYNLCSLGGSKYACLGTLQHVRFL